MKIGAISNLKMYVVKIVTIIFCTTRKFQGVTVLLMGSKEEDLPVEPIEKTVFVEDMNETELATAVS